MEAINSAQISDLSQTNSVETYNAQRDVDFLKSLIFSHENLAVFRQKLNATREYRAIMMTKKETEIKEHFPYFFTHPMTLVCSILRCF